MFLSRSSVGWRALALLVALGASAHAQSFLIDLGPLDEVPGVSYGAGAQVPGYWYAQAGPFDTPQILIDRFGVPRAATICAKTAPPLVDADDRTTSGDDDALCDDGVRCGATEATDVWEFRGLAAGVYHVYTYVFSPNAPDDRVAVEVGGAIDPPRTIGGAWPGEHQEGVTFSRHRLIVTSGGFDVRTTRVSESATVSGFQLIRVDDSIDFGTRYCDATSNSTGSPAHLWMHGTLDALTLVAEPLPEPGPALFFYGPTAAQIPFGNGTLCVGTPHARLRPIVPVTGNAASIVVDLTQTRLSAIHLQCWYRDPDAGGSFFNLTDARALP